MMLEAKASPRFQWSMIALHLASRGASEPLIRRPLLPGVHVAAAVILLDAQDVQKKIK